MTTLTLVWDPTTAPAPTPLPRGEVAPVRVREPSVPLRRDEASADAQRVQHLAGLMVHRALEGLQRRRPLRQFATLFSDEALTVLRAWGSVEVWTSAQVGSVRATALSGRHIEGCARVMVDGRAVMLTLRLHHTSRGWQCDRLDVLCSRGHLETWGVAAA